MKRIRHDRNKEGAPLPHWLDYAADRYGEKLVSDMKIVFSILYLYLPVPIFWSLFDQQVMIFILGRLIIVGYLRESLRVVFGHTFIA